MKTVTLKMADSVLEEMDRHLRLHHFSTRTEFIREAIRDKLKQLEGVRFEQELRTHFRARPEELKTEISGISSDVFKELESRFG